MAVTVGDKVGTHAANENVHADEDEELAVAVVDDDGEDTAAAAGDGEYHDEVHQ